MLLFAPLFASNKRYQNHYLASKLLGVTWRVKSGSLLKRYCESCRAQAAESWHRLPLINVESQHLPQSGDQWHAAAKIMQSHASYMGRCHWAVSFKGKAPLWRVVYMYIHSTQTNAIPKWRMWNIFIDHENLQVASGRVVFSFTEVVFAWDAKLSVSNNMMQPPLPPIL